MAEADYSIPLVAEALGIISGDPELIRQYQVTLPAETGLEMHKRLRIYALAMGLGDALTEIGIAKQSVAQDARSMYQESIEREVYERLKVAHIENGQIKVNLSFREIDYLGRERIRMLRRMALRVPESGKRTIVEHAQLMSGVFRTVSMCLNSAGGRLNDDLLAEFDRVVEELKS